MSMRKLLEEAEALTEAMRFYDNTDRAYGAIGEGEIKARINGTATGWIEIGRDSAGKKKRYSYDGEWEVDEEWMRKLSENAGKKGSVPEEIVVTFKGPGGPLNNPEDARHLKFKNASFGVFYDLSGVNLSSGMTVEKYLDVKVAKWKKLKE